MKKRLLIIPVLLIAGLGSDAYSWLQAPASVSISPNATENASSVLGSETSLKAWQTNLFTTREPSYLHLKTSSEDPHASVIASYLLTSTVAQQSDQVGVTIGTLNNFTLSDIAAVRLRTSQPELYSAAQPSFAPVGALSFRRTDGTYETSVFWQHNNQYVAVVVSGIVQRQAELEQTLETMVAGWQWQQ